MKELIFVFYTKIPKHYTWFEKLKLKAIQLVTDSDIYHVEIVIDDKYISAEPSGLEINKIRKFTDDYKYLLLEVPVTKEQDEKILNWLYSQKGTKYDYSGVFYSQLFGIHIQDPYKWFCSEIANKILQLYFVEPFLKLESSNLAPVDVYNYLKPIAKEVTASDINARKGL